MTAPDLVDTFRALARGYVPELEATPDPLYRSWEVSDGAGLWVTAPTELEAWEKALAAAQRRGAWRARLALRKAQGATS